jgi:uridine kinase
MDLLEQHIHEVLQGKKEIIKPLIDYKQNTITEERISLDDVKVVIVEGTYTSLLGQVDVRVFINRTYEDSLEHRKKRNRGEEVGDPFVEGVLAREHEIIAAHKHLADILITKDYEVVFLSH